MAAITAAGEGLRVLGIESLSMAGGSGTAGGVLGYYYGFKGGLYRKIDSEAHTFDTDFVKTGGVGEGQKITILDRYFKVENVDCRYRASFVGAITETSAKAAEASANAINVSSGRSCRRVGRQPRSQRNLLHTERRDAQSEREICDRLHSRSFGLYVRRMRDAGRSYQ